MDATIAMSFDISFINAPSSRTSSMARKIMQVNMRRIIEKAFTRRAGKKKQLHKKKDGNTYIIGDWLTNIDSTSG
jgi:hypothetical protein